MVQERIEKLRRRMKEEGISVYLISTADFHGSEYVGDYFKERAFMSGFTGSAGTLIVTMEEAGLWTDGRYFIQAARQLEGSGIVLRRMGEEGVPTVDEYLKSVLKDGGCLGFDGRTISVKEGLSWEETAKAFGGSVRFDVDLVDEIWEDRPQLSKKPVWILDESYTGMSVKEKLSRVRKEMENAGAKIHILTSLDDIAWLLNIRGGDVECNPVVLSYFVLKQEEAILFVQPEVISEEVASYLKENKISTMPYDSVYDYAAGLKEDAVLIDPGKANFSIYRKLPVNVAKVERANPSYLMKAMKTQTEVDNERRAHIKDGVAVTRFIYWLKKNIGKMEISEISASDYLEQMRREQEGFLDLSFPTISAYKDNAAMCHYTATKETNRTLEPEGFLLVDSGGQYMEGTTDITRTIALGPLTKEEKESFTMVLRGTINLAMAKFMYGVNGFYLDYLARRPLWEKGLNFNHGTGHGVGYLLNVHEGPNNIHCRVTPDRPMGCVLEEGMITSDEPGFYKEGEYGIRTENLLACRKAEKNEYGQFMEFETLTLVPIDREAVIPEELTKAELSWLNQYHKKVRETLSPYLSQEEAEWLYEVTEPIE